MKKFLLFFVQFTVLFSYAQTLDSAQKYVDSIEQSLHSEPFNISSEYISSFHSDISVRKDASLKVVETITVLANGQSIKRGIFRTLPLKRNLNGKSQKVKYSDISVTKDGVKEDFSENYSGNELKIYIGNKDVVLSPGKYTYQITYSTKNQIGFFEGYDELYWNVNGTNWNFRTAEVSATVHLPEGAKIIQNACYTGESGSTDKNCTVDEISVNELRWKAEDLGPYENLTVAVGFDKGLILPPPPPTFFEKYGVAIFLSLAFLGMLLIGYNAWKKYGVDPPTPVVYPQFNVPEGFSPASLGYIKSEDYKGNYLTAALVNLAIKGYIQIKEKEKQKFLGFVTSNVFEIIKLKEPDDSLPKEETTIMKGLLTGKDSIKLDGKYSSKVETAVENFKANLKYQHDKFLNEGNNLKHLLWPSLLMFSSYLIGLGFSYYLDEELLSIIVGVLLFVFITIVYLSVVFGIKNVKASGCFIAIGIYFLISTFMATVFFITASDISFNFKFCYFFLIFGLGVLFFFKYIIKRPSEEKLQQQSLIDGFKMYMSAAENEQLKFHNPPKITPEVFEKLLPYAMVLGVDAIWGKKFDQVMASSATDYQPNWYVGSTAMNFSSLGSGLNSSLTQSVSSTATEPSSSSSGSGSSGGGFSGGGGGGGGGGGW